jgi:hypothetical protein
MLVNEEWSLTWRTGASHGFQEQEPEARDRISDALRMASPRLSQEQFLASSHFAN